jgi:phenylalanyl-tRNA synthetase beta chain
MNASHAWLQSFLAEPLTAERMRDIITEQACPVDELVRLRDDLKDVVIGLVVECAKHPDADHLSVTKVDAGTGELLEVVCGAPNVAAGKKYPFAPAGSTLPGGLKLEKRKIRGAISNGMLCSARELGLSEEHVGILELDTDAAPGTPFLSAVPVGDVRIVVDVTPNRPDLLSHLGLARELAAATGGESRLPEIAGAPAVQFPEPVHHAGEAIAGGVRVTLEDPAGCPRYMGAVIRGVKVGPSPAWLAERVTAVGSRSINNVVDVTNYMLHEMGQPMHAFDVTKLAGPAVVIRRARAGETLTTLDGTPRALAESMTVIADAERPQALAGVMGGHESEVTAATTDLFLEVAHFHGGSVRRMRRALGLVTDASYRFERGTDPELPPRALARAVRLLLAVAGGAVDGSPVDLHPVPQPRRRIELDPERVGALLGEALPTPRIAALLRSVGFEVADGGAKQLVVIVPTWRPDVVAPVDLLEEVARLHGYDALPSEIRSFRPGNVPDSPLHVVSRRVRDALVGAGLLEARPMPFVKGGQGYLRVANPLAADEAYLRRYVLESLARAAEHNLAQMHRDVRLFEIGAAFSPGEGPLPREEMRAAAVIMGHRRPPHFTEPKPADFDEWDALAVAELMIIAAFPGAYFEFKASATGGLWEIQVGSVIQGVIRRVALDAPVWAAPAFGVELTLMNVENAAVAERRAPSAETRSAPPVHRYVPLPVHPASSFDLALLVPIDLPVSKVESVLRSSAGDLLEHLELLSEFRGAGVPAGQRSVAWRLTLRHPERTLKEKEISGRRDKVLKSLDGELGVRQRTS